MKERATDWLSWFTALLAILFLVFVLTAPPVMISIARSSGTATFPTIYQPFISVIESDYGGPLLWYFNNVWHSGIVLIGDQSGPPVHMVLLYTVIGLALLAAAALPFWRRRVWSHST